MQLFELFLCAFCPYFLIEFCEFLRIMEINAYFLLSRVIYALFFEIFAFYNRKKCEFDILSFVISLIFHIIILIFEGTQGVSS